MQKTTITPVNGQIWIRPIYKTKQVEEVQNIVDEVTKQPTINKVIREVHEVQEYFEILDASQAGDEAAEESKYLIAKAFAVDVVLAPNGEKLCFVDETNVLAYANNLTDFENVQS